MSASGQGDDIEREPAMVAAMLADGEQAQLVDVREPYEREAGYVEGSRHIELAQLPAHADSFARERAVIFYCRLGSRSLMAAQAFRASGYEAYSMTGGLVRWVQEGRTLQPDGGFVAEH
jgi:rhodanese-related sulfurtransferase